MKKLAKRVLNALDISVERRAIFDDRELYRAFDPASVEHRRFYNIGAGNFAHPYWTNVDYSTDYYATEQDVPFLHHDLTSNDPLPIDDEVAEAIYSSHTIEHVGDAAVRRLFVESFRCLRPGGFFRLTTPNARLEWEAFMRRDISYWYWKDSASNKSSWSRNYAYAPATASIEQLFLHHMASQLSDLSRDESAGRRYNDQEIGAHFRGSSGPESISFFTDQCTFNPNHPGNHLNWWSEEKLFRLLKEAGFRDPYVSGYGQSLCAPMRDVSRFDSTHPRMSVYVEARR